MRPFIVLQLLPPVASGGKHERGAREERRVIRVCE